MRAIRSRVRHCLSFSGWLICWLLEPTGGFATLINRATNEKQQAFSHSLDPQRNRLGLSGKFHYKCSPKTQRWYETPCS